MHPSTQKKHTHVCVKATEHTCNLLHTHLLIGYHHVHRQLSVWKFLCWLVTMLNRPLPTRNKSLQLGTEVSTICRSSDQLVDGISVWTQPTFLGTLQGIRMYVTPTFFSVIISYCTKKKLTVDHHILQTKLANPALELISMGFCFKEGLPDGSV